MAADAFQTTNAEEPLSDVIDARSSMSRLYWLTFGLGLAWTSSLWLRSPGTPVQDEIGHLLISRAAWAHPAWALNVWGRPVHTVLYMVPSLGGLGAARFFSLMLSAVIVWLASRAAQQLGVARLFLVPLFLWFQPWFGDLSYSAITEIPFSLLLVAGIWLWLVERHRAAALLLGLLPLARHEGIVIVGAVVLMCILRRDWKGAVLGLSGLALYNILSFVMLGQSGLGIYFSPKPTELYGSGGWLHYIPGLVSKVGLPVVALSLAGVIPLLRNKWRAIAFAPYAIYLATHVLIYRFGLYASGGYELFLQPLAPGFAILAALGVDAFLTMLRGIRWPELKFVNASTTSAAIVAALALVMGSSALRTRPRPADVEEVYAEEAARWIRAERLDTYPIVSTHVWFLYFNHSILTREWSDPPPLSGLPSGSIVVWDRHYSDRWGVSYQQLTDPANRWRLLKKTGEGVYAIFQKQ